jgi:hypothetical protein
VPADGEVALQREKMNKTLTLSPALIVASLTELGGSILLIVDDHIGYPYWLSIPAYVLHYPAILTIEGIRPLRSRMANNLIFLILLQWLLWILLFNVAFFLAEKKQGP